VSHESPKPEDRLVGYVLRGFREGRGFTQEQAAEEAGLHRAQYQRYEAGENAPSFLMVIQIARSWGVYPPEVAAELNRQLAEMEQDELHGGLEPDDLA
jgi:transcriptional regulator with XRE-family HTH domain